MHTRRHAIASFVPDLPPRPPTGVTSTCPSCPGLAKPRRAWRGPAARRLLGGAARSVSPSPPRPPADPPLCRGGRPGGHSGITYIDDQHTIALPGADPATIEQGPNGEVYIPQGGVTIGSTADQAVTSRPPFPSPYPPQSLPGGDGTPSTKVCPPGRAHYESSEGVLRDGSACFDGPRYRPVVSAAWTRGEVLPSISGVLCD